MAGMFLSIAIGLAALLVGAELLVRGAAAVVMRLGMPPVAVGFALTALGTSLPVTAVAVGAVFAGSPGMAIGGLVGANIANCLLAVGLAATIAPSAVPESLIRREGSALTVATLLFVAWGTSFSLGPASGLTMLAVFALYLWMIGGETSRGEGRGQPASKADGRRHAVLRATRNLPLGGALAFAAAGLVLVVYGGRAFVEGAVHLSQYIGLSDSIVGLSVVALATTIPALIASVVAARRGESGLALGNAINACLFNLLGAGGLIGIIGPVPIPASVARFDFPVLVAATLLVLVLASTGRRIARPEGIALTACYGVYLYALFR